MLGAGGEGGDETVFGANELGANVLQQETARTVRVFGFAGAPAKLAEQRGLLVAGDARDNDAAKAESRGNLAHILA